MNQDTYILDNDDKKTNLYDHKKDNGKRRALKRTVISISVIAFIVITAVAFIFNMKPENIYIYPESNIKVIYEFTNHKNIVLECGRRTEITFGGDCLSTISGINGNRLIALTNKSELYYVTAEKVLKIADTVSDYIISPDASSVMFRTPDGELKIWNENGNVTILADKAGGRYAISPDGKCAAYTLSDDTKTEVYIYRDEKKSKIAENVYPLVLSDDCKEVYLYDGKSLYISKQGNTPEKLADDIKDTFYFNADCREIMFCSSEKMYVSECGEQARLVNRGFIDYLLPDNAITVKNYDNITVLPQTSLLNGIYRDSMNAAFKITDKYNEGLNKYETVRYNIQFDEVQITKNGNKAFFLKNEDLFVTNSEKEKINDILAKNVKYFKASEKGDYVYYIDTKGDLYLIDKSSDNKKISSNVDMMKATDSGDLFFISGTKLYRTKKGNEAELIDENVSVLETDNSAIYYMADYNDKSCSGDIYAGNIISDAFSLIEKNSVFFN